MNTVQHLGKNAIFSELKRMIQKSLAIKGTYIKTLSNDDIFDESVNKTTELHSVKVGNQHILVPLVKEEQMSEGAIPEDMIRKIMAKIKDPRGRAILNEYIMQEQHEVESHKKAIGTGEKNSDLTDEQQELKDRVSDVVEKAKKALDIDEVNKVLEEENMEELRGKLKSANMKQSMANFSRTITTLKKRLGNKVLEDDLRKKRVEEKLIAEDDKRKPGRPKKEVIKQVEEIPEEKTDKVVPEKKQRGRPKKGLVVAAAAAATAEPAAAAAAAEENLEDESEEKDLSEDVKETIASHQNELKSTLDKIYNTNVIIALKHYFEDRGDKETGKLIDPLNYTDNLQLYKKLVTDGKIEKGMVERIDIGRGSSEHQGAVEILEKISDARSGSKSKSVYGSRIDSKNKKYIDMVLEKKLHLNKKEKLLFYKSLYQDRKKLHDEIDTDPVYEPLRTRIKKLGGDVVGEEVFSKKMDAAIKDFDEDAPSAIIGSLKITRALKEYQSLNEKKTRTAKETEKLEHLKGSLIASGQESKL